MSFRGRLGRAAAYGVGAMVVMWLTVVVMRGGGWDQADPIASVFGALAGVAALLVTLLRRDSDGEAVAVRLLREVIATEKVQYKQLLGGVTSVD
ncbi:hypothetical protein OG311_37300 [Streptomyces sp. NBC_01343]|uniref:hypothetical protein n=1 Tax=Streptomyces sp. NBC_01343 TaxID=2903832 RepID=UPI002E104AC6|nr:hypothetical protein OG311_37300 [Streptomyces sp. NBC_01343]